MRVSLLLSAIALVAVARFAYAGWLELAPDEAYYARWAAPPLSLVHRDHPPGVAFLVAATTELMGTTERGVRLGAILCAGLTSLFAYALARESGLARGVALGAPLLATVMLLPAVGAVIVTPDAPLMLSWTAGALMLLRARRAGGWLDWLGFGVAAGAALWSKHSGVLLLAAAWAAAAWAAPAPRGPQRRGSQRAKLVCGGAAPAPNAKLVRGGTWGEQRRWLGPAAATAVALVVASAWLAAEAKTGFESLRFQMAHAFAPSVRPPWGPLSRLAELVLGQIALLTPVVAWEAARFLRRPSSDPTGGVLFTLAVLPLGAVAISALGRHPEPSWAAPAYPALVVGALWLWSRRPARSRRNVAVAGLATALVLAVVVHVHAVAPFLPLPAPVDPTSRLHGWGSLARALRGARPLAAADYGVAAELWFYGPGHPDVRVEEPAFWWPLLAARRADGAVVREVAIRLSERPVIR